MPRSPRWSPLPGRLFWTPEGRGAICGCDCQEVEALDLCEYGGGTPVTYRVPHYSQKATGCTFGPLGLDMVLHFGRGLDAALKHSAVALTTPQGDTAYRLNALVLLGGFLIMRHHWTSSKLASAVGKDADAKFLCSWSRAFTADAERVLTVKDCWAGLELASRHGWCDTACIHDDSKLQTFVSKYTWTALIFDATWIIPGLLMVAADPVSVILDTSASTCKRLVPSEDAEGSTRFCSEDTVADSALFCSEDAVVTYVREAADGSAEWELACEAGGMSPASLPGQTSTRSLETLCKEYTTSRDISEDIDFSTVPSDFATFFQKSNIGLVVRTNWTSEEGVPGDCYDDKTFRRFGMEQVNIRVVDKMGALPKPEDVARMIEACDDFLRPESSSQAAVIVHCKGGFGRSMVLALCLAIYRFDLPGSALLGWARIARPGAITCRRQEIFLWSLRGRADVARFAKLPTESRCQACLTECAVQ